MVEDGIRFVVLLHDRISYVGATRALRGAGASATLIVVTGGRSLNSDATRDTFARRIPNAEVTDALR